MARASCPPSGRRAGPGLRLLRLFPLPGGVVLLQELLRPVAEPVVAVAALVADLGEVVPGHAVAVAEEGPVGADLVEARPQGGGGGVLDDHLVPPLRGLRVLPDDDADALEPGGPEPRHRPLHRPGHLGARFVQAHQQADDADRLGPAEADQLVTPPRARAVVLLVVLGAPGRRFALHPDLAFEDAIDAAGEGAPGGPPALRVHEGVALLAGDL